MSSELQGRLPRSMAHDPELRRFVLQMEDPATGTPAVEAQLRIRDVAKLRDILRLEAGDDPGLCASYEIHPDDLEAPGLLSEPPFKPDPIFDTIMPWHTMREAPYLVHTG